MQRTLWLIAKREEGAVRTFIEVFVEVAEHFGGESNFKVKVAISKGQQCQAMGTTQASSGS